jgi:hypothetical protein
MQDYTDFPPVKYFTRVLKTCPRSAFLYTQIWKNKGAQMHLVTAKKNIRKDYLISPTMFRNLLAPLACLNLIHFVESDEKYRIEVMGKHANE